VSARSVALFDRSMISVDSSVRVLSTLRHYGSVGVEMWFVCLVPPPRTDNPRGRNLVWSTILRSRKSLFAVALRAVEGQLRCPVATSCQGYPHALSPVSVRLIVEPEAMTYAPSCSCRGRSFTSPASTNSPWHCELDERFIALRSSVGLGIQQRYRRPLTVPGKHGCRRFSPPGFSLKFISA